MKWANHFEAAKQTIATETNVVFPIVDRSLWRVAATIPTETIEAICKLTSRAFKALHAKLQLLQFTTWELYLNPINNYCWNKQVNNNSIHVHFNLCCYLSMSCSFGGDNGRSVVLNLPLQSTWQPAYLFNHLLKPTTNASDFVGTKHDLCQLSVPASSIILRSYTIPNHTSFKLISLLLLVTKG